MTEVPTSTKDDDFCKTKRLKIVNYFDRNDELTAYELYIPDAYSEPTQTSKMDLFVKTVHS